MIVFLVIKWNVEFFSEFFYMGVYYVLVYVDFNEEVIFLFSYCKC